MRSDAKKNLKKVATAVLKDPLMSQDAIAKETGLSQGSVSAKLMKLDNIDRSSTIIKIEEEDLDIVRQAQKVTSRWFGQLEKQEKVEREDIAVASRSGDISQKRYTILSGANTDDQGGEKEIPYLPYRPETNGLDTAHETS